MTDAEHKAALEAAPCFYEEHGKYCKRNYPHNRDKWCLSLVMWLLINSRVCQALIEAHERIKELEAK